MATSYFDTDERTGVAEWMRGLGRRTAGLLLLAAAAFLALALIGFDPADPSFNRATDSAVRNPAGTTGAMAADLLLQTFGRAGWLVPLVAFFWGLRMAANRQLVWPWLPLVALPLALLASAAFLAGLPEPGAADWPFRVGLGGIVGDFEFLYLSQHISSGLYGWLTGAAALLCCIAALGLRWRESTWALGRMGQGSRWLGRQLGGAAQATTAYSGRLIDEGRRNLRLRRAAIAETPAGIVPEPLTPEDARPGLLARLVERLPKAWPRRRDALGELTDDLAEVPSGGGRLRRGGAGAGRSAAVDPESTGAGLRQAPTLADEVKQRRQPSRPASSTSATSGTTSGPAGGPASGPVQADLPMNAFVLPRFDMLGTPKPGTKPGMTKAQLDEVSRQLESVLDDFGVRGEIIDAKPGPVVTLFELEPAPGTRAARVISLADDIARSLCALSVRVAVVPGRNVIGIELPNETRETVFLRTLLQSDTFSRSEARLALALGKDISGNPIIVDLARMPHLLIAGTTGAGKSVAINAMILSLLYRLTPEQCRIIMIDPKVIELSVYEDIPHLLAPVVTEPHKAVVALKWVVRQMDERYRLMSHLGVRDIFAFNRRIEQAKARGETLTRRVRVGFEAGSGQPIIEDQPIDMTPLPLIVVIVDEVADLMLTAGKEIEHAIQRLSQKARAAGVHLIVATQRPSVDVLTGVIKANLPSRISFRVSSKIDSRTILGEPGAEQLLGQGDMLYLMPGDRIMRIHGPLVTDGEVERVVAHLKTQGEPDYQDEVTSDGGALDAGGSDDAPLAAEPSGDNVYEQAVQIVARDGKASTSYLQRKLSIGYNSAAKLIERMEQDGLITPADHVGRRQVLMGRGGLDGTERTDDD
jgi:S-DNA-T family DNA segregation ATPase FtsK/SpoIIIE